MRHLRFNIANLLVVVLDETVSKKVELVLAYARQPTATNKAAVYLHVIAEHVVSIIDPVIEALVNEAGISHQRLHELAHSFVTKSPDREPVKFGIAILGLFRQPANQELFQTLGRAFPRAGSPGSHLVDSRSATGSLVIHRLIDPGLKGVTEQTGDQPTQRDMLLLRNPTEMAEKIVGQDNSDFGIGVHFDPPYVITRKRSYQFEIMEQV